MKFEAIRDNQDRFPVVLMCRLADVSTSGFYAWFGGRPASERAKFDDALKVHIRIAFRRSRGTYGSPRIHHELAEAGHNVGRRRVTRLMRSMGLQGRVPKPFKATTDSKHSERIADNVLQRDFSTDAPNTVWVGDITYIRTWEGWVYLAVLIDLYSRRVVGYALDDQMPAELCIEALSRATRSRRPATGLVLHSDRGCQYASRAYRTELSKIGAVQSMSRKGNCWDNAVAESFFSTMKTELIYRQPWTTKAAAERAVCDYIDRFYNPVRRHSSNGFVSPIEHELCFASRARLAA